ncbi:hypothetical protein T484DRAFT_1898692, partial [Baffinella frigidus]
MSRGAAAALVTLSLWSVCSTGGGRLPTADGGVGWTGGGAARPGGAGFCLLGLRGGGRRTPAEIAERMGLKGWETGEVNASMIDAAMPTDGRTDLEYALDSTSMITESTDEDPDRDRAADLDEDGQPKPVNMPGLLDPGENLSVTSDISFSSSFDDSWPCHYVDKKTQRALGLDRWGLEGLTEDAKKRGLDDDAGESSCDTQELIRRAKQDDDESDFVSDMNEHWGTPDFPAPGPPGAYPKGEWAADKALWKAASQGDNPGVIHAIRTLGAHVNRSNPKWFQWRAVHFAAGAGNSDTVLLLIEDLGAAVDPIDTHYFTPFLRACEAGHLETCKVLLTLGADVRLRTIAGHTGLNFALAMNDAHTHKLIRVALVSAGSMPHDQEMWDDRPDDGSFKAWSRAVRLRRENHRRIFHDKVKNARMAGVGEGPLGPVGRLLPAEQDAMETHCESLAAEQVPVSAYGGSANNLKDLKVAARGERKVGGGA